MGFLDYGSAKGLGLKHDFKGDIDRLYQREAYRRGVEAEKAEKAKYYASFVKEGTAVAPSNVRRLDKEYDQYNTEIADFMIEHGPAIETDIKLQQEFMKKTDRYLNNDILREDMQVQQEFQKLKDNVGKMTDEQYNIEMERYTEYYENGGDPYVFSNTLMPTYEEILQVSNKSLESIKSITYSSEGEKIIEYEAVTPLRLKTQAITDYSDPTMRKVIDKRFKEYEEGGLFKGFYPTAYAMHVQNLSKGERISEDFVGWNMSPEEKATLDKRLAVESPWYLQDIGSEFYSGAVISGNMSISKFTVFNDLNRSWNLGSEGKSVKIKREDGSWKEVVLYGELQATNFGEILVLDEGGYVRVDVKTIVDTQAKQPEPVVRYEQVDNEITEEEYQVAYNKMNETNRMKLDNGERVAGFQKITSYPSIGKEYYNQANFSEQSFNIPGLLNLPIDPKKGTHSVFSGSIYIPLNVTASTVASYELDRDKTNASKVQKSLTIENIILDNLLAGNQRFAIEAMMDTYGAGTVQNWQVHPESVDNSVYVKEDEDSWSTYNVLTGEIDIIEKQ